MESSTALLAAISGIAFFGVAAPSLAATISFEQAVSPTTAYTHQAATVRNDGTNSNATNNSTRLLAGSVGTGAMRAIFSYDLSDIPAGATISSVTFKIYQEADTGASVAGNYAVQLQTISSTFDETTATWNNTFGSATPMTLGSAVLSSVTMDPEVTAASTTHTFASSTDFVSALQAAADSPTNLFNFVLRVPSVEGGPNRVIMRLGADETNDAGTLIGKRPILTVEYSVPEPTALSLLGLSALAAIARRPRRALP